MDNIKNKKEEKNEQLGEEFDSKKIENDDKGDTYQEKRQNLQINIVDLIYDYYKALSFFKIQNKMGNLVQVHQIKKIRKEIAKILTSVNSSFSNKKGKKFHVYNLLNLRKKDKINDHDQIKKEKEEKENG